MLIRLGKKDSKDKYLISRPKIQIKTYISLCSTMFTLKSDIFITIFFKKFQNSLVE